MSEHRHRRGSTDGIAGRGTDQPDRQTLQREAEQRILHQRTGGKYRYLVDRLERVEKYRDWLARWQQRLERPINGDDGKVWDALLNHLKRECERLVVVIGQIRAIVLRDDR